jgi:hypothetical protein
VLGLQDALLESPGPGALAAPLLLKGRPPGFLEESLALLDGPDQPLPGQYAVLPLAALVGAADDDPGRTVAQDDAGLDLVDVLAARAARAGESLLDILAADAGGAQAVVERVRRVGLPQDPGSRQERDEDPEQGLPGDDS